MAKTKQYKGWQEISKAIIDAMPAASLQPKVVAAGVPPVLADDSFDDRCLTLKADQDGIPKKLFGKWDKSLSVTQEQVDKLASKFLRMFNHERDIGSTAACSIVSQLRVIRRVLEYSAIDLSDSQSADLKQSLIQFVAGEIFPTYRTASYHPREGMMPEKYKKAIKDQLDKCGITEEELSVARGKVALAQFERTAGGFADAEDLRAALREDGGKSVNKR